MNLKNSKIRFKAIFKNPFFWFLTIVGNSIMVAGGFLLMWAESLVPQFEGYQFLDFLLWSAGLITTIGYGDYMAHTVLGKLIVLGLMLFGTFFLWLYMAFLVNFLFTPELDKMEKEFKEIEKEMHDFKLNKQS